MLGTRRISSRAAVWCGGREHELGAPPSPIRCPVSRQLAVLLQCLFPPTRSGFRPATPHLKPGRPAFGRWYHRQKR